MLKLCKSTTKKWNMQIYPIKKSHFCMFLNDFACESFILAHRLDGLDGFLMGSTIDNNYFFAPLREAGNEVSFVKKDQKWGKKLFSLRAITRSCRRTKEMSAHGCARKDAIGRRRTRIESLETLPSGQVGRWDGGKAKQLMAVKISPKCTMKESAHESAHRDAIE